MIFRWVHHTSLNPRERLMMVLFEMGMATLKDLSVVLGYTEDRIYQLFKQIRYLKTQDEVAELKVELEKVKSDVNLDKKQKAKRIKEINRKIKKIRDEWVRTYRKIPEKRGSENRLLALGGKGVEYCTSLMHERGAWEIKESQKDHYDGTNKILVRLIKEFGQERLKWYYSYEARDVLVRTWESIMSEEWKQNPKLARKMKKEMIKPDALCLIDNVAYWIEFDNDTEKTKQLVEKYRSYQKTICPEEAQNIKYPVIWVTTSTHRRDELQNIWEVAKDEYLLKDESFPEMFFFVAGEETGWFKERHGNFLSN
jgi:hypothetical protein